MTTKRKWVFVIGCALLLGPILACGNGDDSESSDDDEGPISSAIGQSFRVPTSGGGQSDFSFTVESVQSYAAIGDAQPPAGQRFVAVRYTGKNETTSPRSGLLAARVILRAGNQRFEESDIGAGIALGMRDPLPDTGRPPLEDVPPQGTHPFRTVWAVPDAVAGAELEVVFTEPITFLGEPREVVIRTTPTAGQLPAEEAPPPPPPAP